MISSSKFVSTSAAIFPENIRRVHFWYTLHSRIVRGSKFGKIFMPMWAFTKSFLDVLNFPRMVKAEHGFSLLSFCKTLQGIGGGGGQSRQQAWYKRPYVEVCLRVFPTRLYGFDFGKKMKFYPEKCQICQNSNLA